MGAEFITMYLPIFREKLAKLERRGEAGSPEAARLRKAISSVEAARTEDAAAPDKVNEAA